MNKFGDGLFDWKMCMCTDPKFVLTNYKTELCRRPLRLCRQGYACPSYHNPRDKRRSPVVFKYR